MPVVNAWPASAEREALRSVARACAAGLDSVTLRREIARRTARLIPAEAYCFSTLDPDTGLVTNAMGEGAPPDLVRSFFGSLYPNGEAERVIDLARSGRLVTTYADHELQSAFRTAGIQGEIRATFALGDQPWGLWCSMRARGARPFGARELAFLRRIAPHVARALRAAALRQAASRARPEDDAPDAATAAPGVVVVDARARVIQQTVTAAAQLADLADFGPSAVELPSAVLGVIGRHFAEERGATWDGELRVRGRSGRWYTLHAELTEPDVTGRSSCVLVITPVGRAEIAPLLARLYGLSPREREVTALVARGYASKEIARRLRISPYTVQDHLDHAAEKVGVRGRRALLAKLYFDGYAKHLHGCER